VPPYDIAGWTLAMQMGVQFDRVLDGFNGAFARVNGLERPPAGAIEGPSNPAGYLISHRVNNSFILTNRLLKAGVEVYWLKPAGEIWVPATAAALPVLRQSSADLGVTVRAVAAKPAGDAQRIKPVRIGLYDQYGGLMPSGWTRWLFEQYEFPFEVIYPQTLDAGNLRGKFDVLVLTDGAYQRRPASRGGRGGAAAEPQNVPAEFRGWLGRISDDKTIPQLKQFVQSGGALVTVGSSTSMAEPLGLAVAPYFNLPRDQFYIPGSLIHTRIDNTNPLAYGMPDQVDVFFDNSPTFKLDSPDVHRVAWYSGKAPLSSGWAWGQEHLDGGVAVAETKIGEGRVYFMGPEVTFRGEPDATFKLMFNALLAP
jgi:hypothetical protein